jgi:hypothetical protein
MKSEEKKMIPFLGMHDYNGRIAVKAGTACPIIPKRKGRAENRCPPAGAAEAHEKYLARLPS